MNTFFLIDVKSLIAFTIPLFAINACFFHLAFGIRQCLVFRWLT